MQEDKRDRLRSALTGLLEQIEKCPRKTQILGVQIDVTEELVDAIKTAKQELEGKWAHLSGSLLEWMWELLSAFSHAATLKHGRGLCAGLRMENEKSTNRTALEEDLHLMRISNLAPIHLGRPTGVYGQNRSNYFPALLPDWWMEEKMISQPPTNFFKSRYFALWFFTILGGFLLGFSVRGMFSHQPEIVYSRTDEMIAACHKIGGGFVDNRCLVSEPPKFYEQKDLLPWLLLYLLWRLLD